jgi:hypothetical protein
MDNILKIPKIPKLTKGKPFRTNVQYWRDGHNEPEIVSPVKTTGQAVRETLNKFVETKGD